MFAVDEMASLLQRLRTLGVEVIGEMWYEDSYRLAYPRGPVGIIVALTDQTIR